MYSSVTSFQKFLNFPIWAFSENVQCFVGVFLKIPQNSLENIGTSASLLKKRPWHRYFPVHFVKFLRTSLFMATASG